jgi:hypothetical protein
MTRLHSVINKRSTSVFGGHSNIGFMESGYLAISEELFSLDEYLTQLLEDLELYYTGHTTGLDIIHKDRM